ncbi:MAG: DUF262 domain-containing protein [Candidatus Peregrinibacteria bacterium]
MANNRIEAEAVSFSEIFKKVSEKHIVPSLQRPYVWDSKKQVIKFFDDINENDEEYFIGSIVFVSSNGTIHRDKIIDGQQRLTTIALILIAIRDIIKLSGLSEDKELTDTLREIHSFIQYIDSFDNEKIIRLEFSDSYTNNFFKILINNEKEKPVTDTQKRLNENYLFIYSKLKEYFIENNEINKNKIIVFFNKVKTLQIVCIRCTDDGAAYELFESINATGLSLASLDLIKNFIFKKSKSYKKEALQEVEEKWQELENSFSENRSLLKTFIRHHWISNGNYTSHSNLYKEVERTYSDNPQDLEKYTNELMNDSQAYLYLRKASIDVLEKLNSLKEFDKKRLKEDLNFLSFLDVDQVYAPCLFFYKNFSSDDFIKYLHRLIAFQFLYKYIPGSPSAAEKVFANICKYKSDKNKISEEFQKLKKLVEKQKEIFCNNFIEKASYKGGDSGDIQFLLERYIFSKGEPYAFKEPTIEHIISQKTIKNKITHNIGNLTVLERSKNSSLPELFDEKIEYYNKSPFPEHKEIISKYEFGLDYEKAIKRRAEDIASAIYDIFLLTIDTGKFV